MGSRVECCAIVIMLGYKPGEPNSRPVTSCPLGDTVETTQANDNPKQKEKCNPVFSWFGVFYLNTSFVSKFHTQEPWK